MPYPFGLDPPRCYWQGYTSRLGHLQLLLGSRADLYVVNISLDNSTIIVIHAGGNVNITSRTIVGQPLPTPYMLSDCNELVLISCNVQATLMGSLGLGHEGPEEIIDGCASFCNDPDYITGWWEWEMLDRKPRHAAALKYCSGIGCCQAAISKASKPKGALYWWFDLNINGVPPVEAGFRLDYNPLWRETS